MTPARGWTEADYYRASRNARRACETRMAQQQIQGVLDEADRVPVGLVEPAHSYAVPPVGRARHNTTADAANPAQDSRGVRQRGR